MVRRLTAVMNENCEFTVVMVPTLRDVGMAAEAAVGKRDVRPLIGIIDGKREVRGRNILLVSEEVRLMEGPLGATIDGAPELINAPEAVVTAFEVDAGVGGGGACRLGTGLTELAVVPADVGGTGTTGAGALAEVAGDCDAIVLTMGGLVLAAIVGAAWLTLGGACILATELGGLDGVATELGGLDRVATELGGLDGVDTELGGLGGVATELGGVDGVATELGGVDGAATELD